MFSIAVIQPKYMYKQKVLILPFDNNTIAISVSGSVM